MKKIFFLIKVSPYSKSSKIEQEEHKTKDNKGNKIAGKMGWGLGGKANPSG